MAHFAQLDENNVINNSVSATFTTFLSNNFFIIYLFLLYC